MIANERRAVLSLAAVYATRMLGLFMVLPVFVIYGDQLLDSNAALIGLAIGAYGLSQAVFQIPFGALSDRVGRKPILYFGLLIFFIGSVIAAQSESIYGVIAGRFIQGAGAIASVIMALLSDLTSAENRTKSMAMVGMSIGVSFTLALILGPIVAEFGGLHAIFWLTAILALAAMLWTMLFVPTPHLQRKNRDARVFKDQLYDVLKDKELLRLDFGIFVLHLVLTAMFVAVPVSLVGAFDFAVSNHWWLYLVVLVGSFFAMVPFIIIGEKQGKMKGIFCFGISLLAVSAFAMYFVNASFLGFASLLFVFFMGFNLLEASLPSLVSKISPAGSKGTAMGVYSTSQFLGAFLGGVLGGIFLSYFDANTIFLSSSVLLFLWLCVAFGMAKPRRERTLTLEFKAGLSDTKLQELNAAISALHGVEDVVVVSDGAAYLKVSSHGYDEDGLAQLKSAFS